MVSDGDRSARRWSSAAWVLLAVGTNLAIWGVSMGFSRRGPGGVSHRNVEAVVRVIVGGGMALLALAMATVVASGLSRFERGWWVVALWVTTWLGALFPLGLLADATSTFVGDDPSSGMAYGFEVYAKAALGSALLATLVTIAWAILTSRRHLEVSKS